MDLLGFSDLWDNFDAASRRTEEGVQLAKEVIGFLRSIASAQAEFAKNVSKACKNARNVKLMSSEASGDFYDTFAASIAAIESTAHSFQRCADNILEGPVDQTEALRKEVKGQWRESVTVFRTSEKQLDSMRSALEHAHSEYCKDSKGAHFDKLSAAAAEGDAKLGPKLTTKAEHSSHKAQSSELLYKNTLQRYNEQMNLHYQTTTPQLLADMHVQDSRRLDALSSSLLDTSEFLRPLGDDLQMVSSLLQSITSAFDKVEDAQAFISVRMSNALPPADLQFQKWTPPHMSEVHEKHGLFHRMKRSKAVEKDEGIVFGGTIEALMARQQAAGIEGSVPRVVMCLIDTIMRLEGTSSKGIFRVPGNAAAVRQLKAQLDGGDYVIETFDVNVPAAALKLWLRELAEPLIPDEIYDICIAIAKDKEASDDEKRRRAVECVAALPLHHKAVVAALVAFFAVMLEPENVERTCMGVANIAMVFGPSFLRTPSDDPHVLASAMPLESAWLRLYLEAEALPSPAPE